MSTFRALARLSGPLYLCLAALTYVLGTGIARYLGIPIRTDVFWIGLAAILFAQVSMDLLAGVFRPVAESLVGDDDPRRRRGVRNAALYVAIAALAAEAALALTLFKDGRLQGFSLLCLALSLVVIVLYAVPPVRLLDRGFGELLLAIQVAYLDPSIGFLLQAGDYHRLLNASILPLTFLLLASLLALDFPSYAEDLNRGRTTLLVRLGWERAVPLHHGLLIAGYALLVAAMLLGFSFRLIWPAFLTVPFAMLQYIFLRNIALGAKPIWRLLSTNAIAVFGLTAYFLTLSFWLR